MKGKATTAGILLLLVGTLPLHGASGLDPEIRELFVEVGSSRVRALCTDGRREVVLLHERGSTAESWRPVLERLDGRVGACAYDRPGSGASRPAPGPRGWYELLGEFREIHAALAIDDGFVLVGHGLGGLYARLHAAERPDEVAGLLLIDPAHEAMPERARAGMPEEAWQAWVEGRRRPNSDGVVERDVGMRAARARLPRIPVTVVTATLRRDGGGWSQRFLNEAAQQVHASILRGVELARHIPASRSGPAVQRDQPQLVTDEILRLVAMREAVAGRALRAPLR